MSTVRRPWRPEAVYGLVGLTLALAIAFGLVIVLQLDWSVWRLLLAWLVGINVSTFAFYGYDKRRAVKNRPRVPELVLHGMALVGGTLGAFLGMRLFRHKTLKTGFRLLFYVILAIQGILLVFLAITFVFSMIFPVLLGVVLGALLTWWVLRNRGRRPDKV